MVGSTSGSSWSEWLTLSLESELTTDLVGDTELFFLRGLDSGVGLTGGESYGLERPDIEFECEGASLSEIKFLGNFQTTH